MKTNKMLQEEKILLSQSMLVMISQSSPSIVSRAFAKLHFKRQEAGSRRKYNFFHSRRVLSEIVGKKYLINKKIQVFSNVKGGSGKTSLCHQICVHMALLGYKVLAIDCDPQANLTRAFGLNELDAKYTLYDILTNNLNVEDCIIGLYNGLDIIPSDISLTRLESVLVSTSYQEKGVYKVFQNLKKKYDFIFLDSSSTINSLNRSVICHSDNVNIVCETQLPSLKGLNILIEEIHSYQKYTEAKNFYRIIANKYESETGVSQEVLGSLNCDHRDTLIKAVVRKSEDIKQSLKRRLPVCAFAKKSSHAIEDLCDLSLAVLEVSSIKRKNLIKHKSVPLIKKSSLRSEAS